MQLVEQGKLALDDAELVGRLAPELRDAKILDGHDESGKPRLREKKVGITLRHLLSHTGTFPCVPTSSAVRWIGVFDGGKEN